jgi:hypothetical protein
MALHGTGNIDQEEQIDVLGQADSVEDLKTIGIN